MQRVQAGRSDPVGTCRDAPQTSGGNSVPSQVTQLWYPLGRGHANGLCQGSLLTSTGGSCARALRLPLASGYRMTYDRVVRNHMARRQDWEPAPARDARSGPAAMSDPADL